jgi:hypothetical protein
VSKAVAQVMQQFADKQITLFTTIQQIEQQRNSAIAQLSGKKGGQKVLDQLLPQLDQQLGSLQQQQQQIKQTFEQNVLITAQNNDVTKQWLTDWIGINQQVQQYVNAVGVSNQSLQQATQYLNQMLAQERLNLNNTLNSDQTQAIQDAINLNNLLLQRNQMQVDYEHSIQQLNLQYQQTYQQTVGGNSLERLGDPTRDSAKKLALEKQNYAYQLQQMQIAHDQEMTNLNAEIQQLNAKVDIERQLFGLAQDTATLEQEAYQASLYSLTQYAAGVKAIQDLLAATQGLTASGGQFPGSPFYPGIFPNSGGVGLGPIPGQGVLTLPGTTSSQTIINNINVPSGTDDPVRFGKSISDQIELRLRTTGRSFMPGI